MFYFVRASLAAGKLNAQFKCITMQKIEKSFNRFERRRRKKQKIKFSQTLGRFLLFKFHLSVNQTELKCIEIVNEMKISCCQINILNFCRHNKYTRCWAMMTVRAENQKHLISEKVEVREVFTVNPSKCGLLFDFRIFRLRVFFCVY